MLVPVTMTWLSSGCGWRRRPLDRMVAANVLSKHSQIADKGWFLLLCTYGTLRHKMFCVTKFYTNLRTARIVWDSIWRA